MNKLLRIILASIIIINTYSCTTTELDFLIKSATIIDGSGSPGYISDVGLIGDTIVKIGKRIKSPAKVIIQADKRILAPGFIDLHTHCDWGMDKEETKANLNYLIQGVTSVVIGNCGYGQGEIIKFKERFEKNGIGNNMIPLTGFGWLRNSVMGDEDRDPTEAELQEMKDLLKSSLEQGSWGLSSGLQYVPEIYSSTSEVIEIAKVMSGTNRIYATHMRSEEDELVEATIEAIKIAREANVPLNISHLKANGRNNWKSMDEVFKLVEEAQATGMKVTADMYPYDKSATSQLYTVLLYPEKLNLTSVQDIQKALIDPVKREVIRELTEMGRIGQTNWVAKGGWNYFSIVDAPDSPEVINKMFIDLAEESNTTAFDIAADLVIKEGENIIISLSTMLEANLIKQMQKDWVMFSSDGSAVSMKAKGVHPRNYGSQARVLRKYVSDENILSLESGIYKLTRLPAKTIGLKRKGLIKEGYSADLVLFDLENIDDPATFLKPHQYAKGIDFVWVNGKIAIQNSEFQNQFYGKVLLANK